MGKPIRGVSHLGTMERGGESVALVPVPNRGSAHVFRRTAGARKNGYATRVEALRRRFGQETDTTIALQELARLRRGKNQSADSTRRLASRAYHSNDYASQEKAALHAFQTAVGEDLQLKCAERSCRTLEIALETVEIQERYTKKAVRALKQEESELALYLKAMGEKLEALMGEIKDDREQRRFLRQELLRKVGHSWWNRPRVYRHDLADERESTPSVRSVVVIPSDPEQPEVSPEQQGPGPSGSRDRMTLVGPVASPITSLPRTLGRDILLPGDAEESPRTRERLGAQRL